MNLNFLLSDLSEDYEARPCKIGQGETQDAAQMIKKR